VKERAKAGDRSMNAELIRIVRQAKEAADYRIMEMELFRIEKEAMAREAEQKQQSA
jgi:hypothetical protein